MSTARNALRLKVIIRDGRSEKQIRPRGSKLQLNSSRVNHVNRFGQIVQFRN